MQKSSTQENLLALSDVVKNLNEALYAVLGVATSDIGAELRRELLFRRRVLALFQDDDFRDILNVEP